MSQLSTTASDYIKSQLRLEEDAREVLPYQFDTCTNPLGPLRQSVFACMTCTPPPATQHQQFTPAGICYSCSISCHGDHNLVEIFTKRNFTCDCGTTRYTNSKTPCSLRLNTATSRRGGVVDEEPRAGNSYDHNFAGKFCGCGEGYDPELEKGTMFQCLGLGTVEQGGCGEDWWHPECLLGLPRAQLHKQEPRQETTLESIKEEANVHPAATATKHEADVDATIAANKEETQSELATSTDETPLPPGFPAEDDFDHLICYKCARSNPWIKQYAGTSGFLPAVHHKQSVDGTAEQSAASSSRKRSAEDNDVLPQLKKARSEENNGASCKTDVGITATNDTAVLPSIVEHNNAEAPSTAIPGGTALHETLPQAPVGEISLFLKEDFREHFCRCSSCFPRLARYPQLLEEEESYEPPLSESDEQDDVQSLTGRSVNSGSLLERGEAALSGIDRVRAIEGVMAYNHVRDKVKEFLQPFAESGKIVGAEDIKAYFAQLRGDAAPE